MLDHVTDGVFRVDRDFVYQYLNAAGARLVGRTPESLIGRCMWDEFPDARGSVFETRYREALETQQVVEFEEAFAPLDAVFAIRVFPAADGLTIVYQDVTAIARARSELAASEERYRQLAEHAADVANRVDLDGVIRWCSRGIVGVLGYSPEEVVGRPAVGFVHPDDVPVVERGLRAAQAGEWLPVTVRLLAKDGSIRWVKSTGSIVYEDGRPVGLIGGWRDVTSEVETRRALGASEERYRLLAENASDVVVYATAEGMVEWVSPSVTALLGWTREEFVGHRNVEFVHPDDRPQVLATQAGLLAGETLDLEVRVRTANGGYRWIATHVKPVLDDRGTLTGRIVGLRDIEEERAARAAEAAAQERFRLLAENASDIVYEAGPDHLIKWIAPNVQSMLGWAPADLVGTTFNDLIHPDDRPVTGPLRDRLYDGRASIPARKPTLMRLRTKDGTYRWFAGRARPLQADDGSPAGLVAGLQWVDAMVESNRQIQEERARLRATLDSMIDPHVMLEAVRDDDGRIVDFVYRDVNHAAIEALTMATESPVGRRLLDVMPAHASTGLLALYAEVIENGEPLILDDFRFPDPIQPAALYYDLRAVRVGECVSITWRDVTERHDLAQQVAESEEEYRLLAENSSDVVLRTRDNHVIWVSPSLKQALGWDPQAWVGHSLAEFGYPEDHAKVLQAQTKLRKRDSVRFRVRLADVAGAWHWIDAHAQQYRDAHGEPDGYLTSFRIVDIEVEAEGLLERRATYDDLTGVLKRDVALKRLHDIGQRPRTPGSETAVLFIDVDGFKKVNDTYGHAAGDALLRRCASVVSDCVRAGDTVARMGGDEFLVILSGLHELAEATAVAEKIRAACAEPLAVGQDTISATVSIGVTVSNPIESGDEIVARADHAMYEAKAAGRNQVVTVAVLVDPT